MSNKEFNARHGVSVGSTPTVVIDSSGEILTNAATSTKLLNSRTFEISGDVVAPAVSFDGTANVNLVATIQANSVALGTDTTGNYLIDVSAGTGVSVSHTQSEGSTATISIGQAVGTSDNVTFNNLTLTGELRGPATFVIDPAAVGDNTGKVVIKGDLQIDGTTTTINSTTITVDDLVITLGGDTAPASDDTFDKGVEYRWYDTQARVGFFGFDRSTGKLTFIPQSTLSSGVYSGTKGEVDAYLDWANVLNKPTIDNTTYNQLAVTTTGGALLRLNSSSSTNDDIKLASGTNVTVAYTNDDTITISSVDTDTTYSVKVSTQTNGAGLDLDAGGSGSGTDTVKILGSGGTTVARTDADTITITTTSIGDGTLSTTTTSAGATGTDVSLELSGAYSANTSNNRTIKTVVGPALTALATLMSTAGPGFIRRTAVADTFSVDTSVYLTAESDTLQTVSGRGSTSNVTSISLTNASASLAVGTSTVNATSIPTIQINTTAQILGFANQFAITNNAYYNSGYKYTSIAPAAKYSVSSSGVQTFSFAASPAAIGDAITWTDYLTISAAGAVSIAKNISSPIYKQSQGSITGNTATTTLDFSQYGNFYITLSTNTALSFSNLASNIGSSGYIFLKQDTSGARTFTFPTEAKTPGGRTFTQNTTANSLSLITFYVVDASTVIVNYIADFK